jgi:hypothetical protein
VAVAHMVEMQVQVATKTAAVELAWLVELVLLVQAHKVLMVEQELTARQTTAQVVAAAWAQSVVMDHQLLAVQAVTDFQLILLGVQQLQLDKT